MYKGFGAIRNIIVIIIILAIGHGYYNFYQQINTEGWKTYTNNAYKFTLKYPADWSVIDQSHVYKGKQIINVSVKSPIHLKLVDSRDAVFYMQMGYTDSRKVTGVINGFMKWPFLASDGGPLPID